MSVHNFFFFLRMGVDQDTASVEMFVTKEDEVQTIEEARTIIKMLRDRCRFQTHQTLMWRRKAKIQVLQKSVVKISRKYRVSGRRQ